MSDASTISFITDNILCGCVGEYCAQPSHTRQQAAESTFCGVSWPCEHKPEQNSREPCVDCKSDTDISLTVICTASPHWMFIYKICCVGTCWKIKFHFFFSFVIRYVPLRNFPVCSPYIPFHLALSSISSTTIEEKYHHHYLPCGIKMLTSLK